MYHIGGFCTKKQVNNWTNKLTFAGKKCLRTGGFICLNGSLSLFIHSLNIFLLLVFPKPNMWLNNFHHFLFLFRIQEGIVLLEFTLPTSRLHGILILHPHHVFCPSFSVFPHLQNKGIAPNIFSCCTPFLLLPSPPFFSILLPQVTRERKQE